MDIKILRKLFKQAYGYYPSPVGEQEAEKFAKLIVQEFGKAEYSAENEALRLAKEARRAENEARPLANNERSKYWPVSPKLMAQYKDGTHTTSSKAGTLVWYQNDLIHRDGDLPAVIDADSSLEWFQNGERHRDGDRPAYIQWNGHLEWWQNNKLHRDGDLPAIIRADGGLYWYQNSLKHRSCGPAVVYSIGTPEWWWQGEYIAVDSQEEFVQYLQIFNLKGEAE